MSVLGKITVVLSDDERYAAGQTYDVVLSTPQTPDPASLLTGSMDQPTVERGQAEPAGTGPDGGS